MELLGQRQIGAPRAAVWDALNDPQVLLRSIPGCEDVEKASETETLVRVAVRLGPVRARFVGKMSMSDVVPAERCTLSFDGAGGAAGFAKGVSNVALRDTEGGTLLDYSASASVGGKLGQIGSRLIDASAKKIADEFFVNLERELTGPSASAEADGEAGPAATGDAASLADRDTAAPPLRPAPASSGNPGRSQTHSASAAPQPASAWSGGWRAELYRAGWFALGVAVTLLLTHWPH
ncbi:SRPBCC family protein [Paraburkholderia sp. BCC1885]|uniref:SRPBCC family protein n=1 Tax=Paraburkholderia sp. BCC1885 TaxID=2562669 RepID=UPI001182490F|nr:carbon monoxide dehydrogenase subunit G [Paraburkholderia sp. BCC1885]